MRVRPGERKERVNPSRRRAAAPCPVCRQPPVPSRSKPPAASLPPWGRHGIAALAWIVAVAFAMLPANAPASETDEAACAPPREGVVVSSRPRGPEVPPETLRATEEWLRSLLPGQEQEDPGEGEEPAEADSPDPPEATPAAWSLGAVVGLAARETPPTGEGARWQVRLTVVLELSEADEGPRGLRTRSRPLIVEGRGAEAAEATSRALGVLTATRGTEARLALDDLFRRACALRDARRHPLRIVAKELAADEEALLRDLLPAVLAPWAEAEGLPAPQPGAGDDASGVLFELPGARPHGEELHRVLVREALILYALDDRITVRRDAGGTELQFVGR